ncbi:MAG: hypothetical protein DRP70_01035 [Spirochaetes bacterium]|nr:MAG: hypothetical protein DRP70_01035 [Spirochaetota bacterium]RKX98121.1 MAG: hypothetical protein DRZ90_03925 [Spirochaetota bacterium]
MNKNRKTRISCGGDSNTDGWPGELNYTPYTYFLQFLLGKSYEVMNFGRFNTTVTFSMDDPYVMNEKFNALIVSNPDIVNLEFGANDSKDYNWKVHGKYFRRDYSIMIERIKNLKSGPTVILCTPARIFPGNPYKVLFDEILTNEIVPQVAEMANEYNLNLLDLHRLLDEKVFYDKDLVHLNNKGHEAVAENLFKIITGLDS